MVAPPSEADSSDRFQRPRWRYAGRLLHSPLLDPVSGRLRCDSPVRLVSSLPPYESRLVPCERRCPVCLARYRRHVATVVRHGVDISTHPFAYWVTLSAPGGRTDLSVWNPTAGACWDRFMTAIRRFDPTIQYVKSAEVQERGALHHHAVMLSSVPLTRNRVSRLAKRAGYGYMCWVKPVHSGVPVYLAKYVGKASGVRESVPWSVERVANRRTGETRRVAAPATYRTWSRSHRYGITMRAVKERAFRAWETSMLADLVAEQDAAAWHVPPPEPVGVSP